MIMAFRIPTLNVTVKAKIVENPYKQNTKRYTEKKDSKLREEKVIISHKFLRSSNAIHGQIQSLLTSKRKLFQITVSG